MAKKTDVRFQPPTPGDILRNHILRGTGITQDSLASALAVSRITVNQIINGRRTVTADMALRLARVLSTTPDFWLNLQRDLDIYEATRALGDELKHLPVLRPPQRSQS
jgi:addiction module HigA family antidote